MLIAIPKEILSEEKRVAATPETVKKYIDLGFSVSVEAGVGEGVFISDDDYKNAGATSRRCRKNVCRIGYSPESQTARLQRTKEETRSGNASQ